MLRTGLLAACVVVQGGCSFLLVDGPPDLRPEPGTGIVLSELCTTSMLYPALDALWGTYNTVLGGYVLADDDDPVRAAGAGVLAYGGLHLWSAWNGRKKVKECREYLEEAVSTARHSGSWSVDTGKAVVTNLAVRRDGDSSGER